MATASWFNKRWEVNYNKIINLKELQGNAGVEKETNDDFEGQSPIYFIKRKLRTFSTSFLLSADVGVNVKKELQEWDNLCGMSSPLFIGGRIFGPNSLMLNDIDYTIEEFSLGGNIRNATITLNFTEDAEEESQYKISLEFGAPGIDSGGSKSTSKWGPPDKDGFMTAIWD